MKVRKGELGYIKAEKKKRTLITLGLFALPLIIFFTGLIITKTRLNMFTFVAIMGCLPASRCAVGMIMMRMQKPVERSVYEQVEARAGDLTRTYELVLTAYEKNTAIDSLIVCGYHVVAYSSSEKTDPAYIEKHISKILKGNSFKNDVKVFTDLGAYLERVSYLAARRGEMEKDIPYTPNETYPDLSRSELVKHTILAISL